MKRKERKCSHTHSVLIIIIHINIYRITFQMCIFLYKLDTYFFSCPTEEKRDENTQQNPSKVYKVSQVSYIV